MYKEFGFTACEVYDLSRERNFGKIFRTIEDAVRCIKEDDNELREEWRAMGGSRPFRHHDYEIREMKYTAEMYSESDDYMPSFSTLCSAVTRWKEGKHHVMYRFED